MDKLPQLKQCLISAFSNIIRKAQRGYPLKGYKDVKDAMMYINYIENFTVDSNKSTAIIDLYLRRLNNI